MRLLLDTHVFLWAVTANPRLKSGTRDFLSRADAVYVSAVSIWEIAIKARLGRIDADAASLADAIDSSGFMELPVTAHHAAAVAKLPLHHTDPFDRLLVAQAFLEPLRFVTADGMLAAYGGAIDVV
jgi:PIN domain nuclease of toxin-antitoxin system